MADIDINLTINKATVGLGNVDNTSDANKPVSAAQAAAIDVVQNDVNAHEARTDNPHSVTKAQVGLGSADNTSDANKPVSTAQANADAVVLSAAQTYSDGLLALTYRPAGGWDASGNTFPTVGTGTAGAVRRGDVYNTTVAGTPAGFETLDIGDNFYALVNSPGQTAGNWSKFEVNTQQATESFRGTLRIATQAEIEDNTTTLDTAAVTPKKWWQGFNKATLLAWTWSLKQTFTTAPRFNSVSASQYLKVDGNKDLTSQAAIPATDVMEDATHRFATDAEKASWNAKEPGITGTTSADFWSGAKTFLNFATTVRATVLTGVSFVTTTAITAADTALVAWGKLQAQITLRVPFTDRRITALIKYPGPAITHTGTTAETKKYSQLITGGSFGSNDAVYLGLGIGANLTANNKTFRLYFNATDDLVGATLVATVILTNNQLTAYMDRVMQFDGSLSSQKMYPVATNSGNYLSPSAAAPAALTINFANDQYFIVTEQLANAGDTGTIYNIRSHID